VAVILFVAVSITDAAPPAAVAIYAYGVADAEKETRVKNKNIKKDFYF